jgi:hypothetical protein
MIRFYYFTHFCVVNSQFAWEEKTGWKIVKVAITSAVRTDIDEQSHALLPASDVQRPECCADIPIDLLTDVRIHIVVHDSMRNIWQSVARLQPVGFNWLQLQFQLQLQLQLVE